MYFDSRSIPRSKWVKTSQKIDTLAIEHVIKYVINNNWKVRNAAGNFGISNIIQKRLYFKKQPPTECEYRHINDVKKMFGATQGYEFVVCFWEAEILHYGHTKNECAGNMWLRVLWKVHESLCLRTPEASSFTRSTGFRRENVRAFFENL
jgi:hypothetical protein